MDKKKDFSQILEMQGVRINKLPLNYGLITVMDLSNESVRPEREVESTFYRSQKLLCQCFHKPISRCFSILIDE
jgi:hypothetical protein